VNSEGSHTHPAQSINASQGMRLRVGAPLDQVGSPHPLLPRSQSSVDGPSRPTTLQPGPTLPSSQTLAADPNQVISNHINPYHHDPEITGITTHWQHPAINPPPGMAISKNPVVKPVVPHHPHAPVPDPVTFPSQIPYAPPTQQRGSTIHYPNDPVMQTRG